MTQRLIRQIQTEIKNSVKIAVS